jgi:hypothetical protein
MATLLLSDETIARIQNFDRSLISDAKDGKRTMQLRLMCFDSDSTQPITIPTNLESVATLEFLAFTPKRAAKLFDSCTSRKLVDLFICAKEWVEQTCASGDTAKWGRVMTEAGIKVELRASFTNEAEYAEIRGIQDLDVWLVEVLETNYYALECLEKTILDRIREVEAALQLQT